MNPIPVTFNFSESVSNFVSGDVSVTGGTLSGFSGSGSSYSANITPSGPGTITVNVAANVAVDSSGSGNTAALQLTRTYAGDTTPPRVSSITRQNPAASPTNADSLIWRVTFNEAVSGVSAASFTPSGTTGTATVSSAGGNAYDVTVSGGNLAGLNGTVTLGLSGSHGISDSAGNALTNVAPTGANESFVVDNTAPTTTITSTATSPTNTSPIPVTVTFSEVVTGFADADVSVGNGSVSSFAGSGTTYTFNVIPAADGNVTVNVAANVAADAAGNGNAAATQLSIEYDSTSPGLTISGVPGAYLPGDTFVVTFTFAENVTGFDASDVVVTGGNLSNFAGGSPVWTATVTPGNTNDVTVAVSAGAAQDAAGNDTNGASATSAIDSAAISSEQIAYFMENRAHSLISNQPNLTRFLGGRSGGRFNATISSSAMGVDFASGAGGPAWFTFQGSHSESGTTELTYGLFSFGTQIVKNENLLVGIMAQLDHSEQMSDSGIWTTGTGWLAGPYMVRRLGDQPLFLEARLLAGQSHNSISPLGTFTDQFTSSRLLAKVGIEGQYQLSSARLFCSRT